MSNAVMGHKEIGYVYGLTVERRMNMTREQKFWNAVYRILGETSRLAEQQYISDDDYTFIIQAMEQSIKRFRAQQNNEVIELKEK